eukprot:TRINITY_DN15733_c0_g1_i1.p1 TRINITY_DN15733_c0_g1~~TRINITY_DN15733_c0_g1_i1.p1  ORF type:complete len:223 (-),score=56.36 TRINITY_DN15733_c0_g1_i1:221-889(-)
MSPLHLCMMLGVAFVLLASGCAAEDECSIVGSWDGSFEVPGLLNMQITSTLNEDLSMKFQVITETTDNGTTISCKAKATGTYVVVNSTAVSLTVANCDVDASGGGNCSCTDDGDDAPVVLTTEWVASDNATSEGTACDAFLIDQMILMKRLSGSNIKSSTSDGGSSSDSDSWMKIAIGGGVGFLVVAGIAVAGFIFWKRRQAAQAGVDTYMNDYVEEDFQLP